MTGRAFGLALNSQRAHMDLVQVKYVGRKPSAHDNVAGSGKTWEGHGDVQEVTPLQARTLIRYADQWELVEAEQTEAVKDLRTIIVVEDEDGKQIEVDAASLTMPVERMAKYMLVALAKHTFKKDLSIKLTKKVMLDQIEEWSTQGVE